MITIYVYDEFGTDTLKMHMPQYSNTAKKIGASVKASGEDMIILDFDDMKFCGKSLFQELLLFELVNKQVSFINMNKTILNNALTCIREMESPPTLWICVGNDSIIVKYV